MIMNKVKKKINKYINNNNKFLLSNKKKKIINLINQVIFPVFIKNKKNIIKKI